MKVEFEGTIYSCAGFETEEEALAALNNPVELNLEQVKFDGYARLETIHSRLLKTATGRKSLEERDTWQPKAIAALALVDGTANDAQTTMLETEALARGITAPELAEAILGKSAAYHNLIGLAAALRSSAKQQIEAATTTDKVTAILDDANQQAAAMMAPSNA